MRKTIEFAWKAIEAECKRFQKNDSSIQFHKEKFDDFDKIFRERYHSIMDRFMKETTELDSHKQAAIITISALEAEIVQQDVSEGQISIVPQLIAINVGLSYMNDRLNDVLSKKRLGRIGRYILPVAIACDTPYIEIMSRILYYEQTQEDMSFNVLELADRFFLLEYINLMDKGIEPYALKDA